ncbi:MAG: tRNA pseudouridine(38-40) synthase TruA [Holdemanella sp.]|nr:tRNA pseudouridine(38-40) synthase TruA [Holdemanella sp.]
MIYKCTVSYDGSNYAGWQKQINAIGIQEIIEKALTKINKEPIEVVASGRTDAKVHALGQVFHFDATIHMPCENYKHAINALLPYDIRIVKVEEENDDFHARFSAKYKRYDYVCSFDKDNPFLYKYAEFVPDTIDIEKMKEASKYLLGTHDFTSFSSSRIDERKPRIKTITTIEFVMETKGFRIIFKGTGFLRYQVRMMTATLLEVGKHKIECEEVKEILEKKDKMACRYNANAAGLYLVEVLY